MVTLTEFLTKIEEIASESPVYKLGKSGDDGECDCIGLVIGAIRRAGGSWSGTHGTNYAMRCEMASSFEISSVDELQVGMAVYKYREQGDSGYSLPSRYEDGGRDYYHVGVVTGVNPLQITHCSTTVNGNSIHRDTKLGKWRIAGWLKKIDTEASDMAATIARAKVVAESGSTVNVRAEAKSNGTFRTRLNVGTEVEIAREDGDWCYIKYQDKTGTTAYGYMMSKFLEIIPEETGDTLEERVTKIEEWIASHGGWG